MGKVFVEITGDAAVPGASNWVTILRPEEDSGAGRGWSYQKVEEETTGSGLQLRVQDYPQKSPEREPSAGLPIGGDHWEQESLSLWSIQTRAEKDREGCQLI